MIQDMPSWAKPDLWLDDDHAIEFLTRPGETEPYGAHIWHRWGGQGHRSSTHDWCLGTFQWRGTEPRANWELHSLEPLHVEPSIQCSCGAHGFIRGGKWDPA